MVLRDRGWVCPPIVLLITLVIVGFLPWFVPPASAVYRCEGLRATISGTAGRDLLVGTNRADVIVGLGGNDVIRGRGSQDFICGGRGRDLTPGPGARGPPARGGRSRPHLRRCRVATIRRVRRDSIDGGSGNDRIYGGPAGDSIDGGSGDDLIAPGGGKGEGNYAGGGRGDDLLLGGPDSDQLGGGAGDDRLYGDGGWGDRLLGGPGDDLLDGGPGARDEAVFEEMGPLTVDLRTGIAVLPLGRDLLVHIEDPGDEGRRCDSGDRLSNKLDGWYGDDHLLGFGRHDSLQGSRGDDVLRGGGGRPDHADGGKGTDRCDAEDERNCES